jgi:methylisocitrate lyase
MNAAALGTLKGIRRAGTQAGLIDTMQTREELYQFLDYHRYELKLDELFAAGKTR